VRVVPDVSGIDKAFDYCVPADLEADVRVGSIVRIPLSGRRVRGWVIADDVEPPGGVELRPLASVVSIGPSAEVVSLVEWAGWRFAGRLRPFLLAASPPRIVTRLPPPLPRRAAGDAGAGGDDPRPGEGGGRAYEVRAALTAGLSVLRLPPAAGRLAVVEAVLDDVGRAADTLVLVPTRAEAERLTRLLADRGRPAALHPEAWARGAAGGSVVVGARGAAFAPLARLGAIVVLDAHSESYVETRAPTWSAAVVAARRAAEAAAPCLLVSPCPTPELLSGARLVTFSRAEERDGWPAVEVLDRRRDDPRSGRYAPGLAELIRRQAGEAGRPVVLVLGRKGRARLLACAACGSLVLCEACGRALAQRGSARLGEASTLSCSSCGTERPAICASCGSTRLKVLRVGTAGAAEEVAALTGLDVREVTAEADPADDAGWAPAQVLLGTEAVLHRARAASLVVFLDLDADLAAPRLRAGERVLAQLAGAARLLGGRRRGGRIVIQTRLPEHEVIRAAVHADPSIATSVELARRERLRLPPAWAVALVEGEGAPELADALRAISAAAGPAGDALELSLTPAGGYLVRAHSYEILCDALAEARATGASVRVEVDPIRI
jgi:primosomal protein N' (replication factor Y)